MNQRRVNYFPCALSIAGSDSGGGAGVQADLRTFWASGVYGCSVITAVTSQNPVKVSHIEALSSVSVATQTKAVFEAYSVGSVKTGMLFNVDIINSVADALSNLKVPLVVDPVMVSTSGAALLEKNAIETLKEKLIPRADWITPNIPEAELLLDRKIKSIDDMKDSVRQIGSRWGCNCILKGGHAENSPADMVDVVLCENTVYLLSSPSVRGSNATHGTGCVFSAALTAAISRGDSSFKSLCYAKQFVYGSLIEEVEPGEKVHSMYPPAVSYEKNVLLQEVF